MKYAIEINDEFILLEDGGFEYLLFDNFEEADDYNYEFEQTLEEGVTSAVVEFN